MSTDARKSGQGPVVLAAGGTGGHLFPAEALGRELLARSQPVVLVTDQRGQALGDKLPSVPVHRIRAGGMAPGLAAKLRAMMDLGTGTMQAARLLRQLRPRAVVGFGGYPSVPAVAAAVALGIPVILHEQNAVLGRANRLLAGGARRIATTFPDVSEVRPRDLKKLVRTGNPVRPPIGAVRATPYQAPTEDGPIRLFVLGGSQGARIFSDLMPGALAALPEGLRSRIHLSQQARPEDIDRTRAELKALGLADFVVESFFGDVPERMIAAHLVICRAGASTCAEVTCIGRPAVLVPYPFAMDDHQTANARALVAAGAGWCFAQDELSTAGFGATLEALLERPGALVRAAGAAARWGVADAASQLADVVGNATPANCNAKGTPARGAMESVA